MPITLDGTNGITSPEPFVLTSGSLSSPAVAGQTEYDGKVFYKTPQGTQRGIVPAAQFFRLLSALPGADVNTAQSVFGVGVTLSASTVYAFEAVFALSKSAGAVSHSMGLSFGGTATLNNIAYEGFLTSGSTSFTNDGVGTIGTYIQVATNTTFSNGSSTAATLFKSYNLKGTVSINAGGTFIPQYTLSAAPGGAYTTALGSYMLIYPISTSGANTNVGTWA